MKKKMFGLFGSNRQEAEDDSAPVESVAEYHRSDFQPDLAPEQLENERHLYERTRPVAHDPLDDLPGDMSQVALADDINLGAQTQAVADDQSRAVSELGGRHELIVARLGQIGEILQQLNDAHKLVDRLGTPLSATFRHHQILAGQNIALQHALDRVNGEVSSLREREVTATARSTSLELELRHLNDSYAQLQEAQARAEEELRSAAGEIRSRDATISDLERRVHELSTELGELRSDLAEANSRWQEGATAQNALTQQLRLERENYQTLEHEHEGMRASLQQTVAEAAQLSRQLAEAEETAAAARSHAREVEKTLADTQADKTRLLEQVNELELSVAEERRNLAVKAESMRGRSETLDKLLAQARAELSTQADALRESQHRGSEMKAAIARLEAKCDKALADLQRSEAENRQLSEANAALTDRVDSLNKVIQSKDEALQRNREVLDSQAARLGALEGQASSQVETYERQLAGFAAALEQEKAERALLEGTLEAARQEKQRLQRQLIQYRSNLVDESSADVAQLAKVPYPTVEALSGLVPKPSVEAPPIVVRQPEPQVHVHQEPNHHTAPGDDPSGTSGDKH